MATLGELARQHTDLDLPSLGHLQRLMASWGMLSDLCFADLLLFVPVIGGQGSRFIVLGQMRPTTMVFVTHSIEEAVLMGDRVVVL